MNILAEFRIQVESKDQKLIYPTFDLNLNFAIQHYLETHSLIEDILFNFKLQHAGFNQGLYYAYMRAKEPLTIEDLKFQYSWASPNDGGPDGWMEKDLYLNIPYDSFEIIPYITRIWIFEDNQWVLLKSFE